MSAEQNPYAAPVAPVDAAGGTPGGAPTGPRGIGGWLVLPLLGLIVTPIRIAIQTVRDLAPAFSPATWEALTTPGGPAYDPMWAPVIVFEAVASFTLVAFTLILLWLFFRKSRRVPLLMILWLLTTIGLQVADLALAAQIPVIASQPDPQSLGELARSAVGALIWIPYFLVSKRVKNTFVE
jgi:hypothetical protein